MQIKNGDKHMGKIISRHRFARKMTQEQLGQLVGCSPSFIGQVERGESMPSVTLLKNIICNLNIDANDLFWESKNLDSEDVLLENQIQYYANRMNTNYKKFILSVIEHLSLLQ